MRPSLMACTILCTFIISHLLGTKRRLGSGAADPKISWVVVVCWAMCVCVWGLVLFHWGVCGCVGGWSGSHRKAARRETNLPSLKYTYIQTSKQTNKTNKPSNPPIPDHTSQPTHPPPHQPTTPAHAPPRRRTRPPGGRTRRIPDAQTRPAACAG
jgi:hypothetical protein